MGQGDTLAAVLGTGNLGDCLCCDITGCGKAAGLFDHGFADNGSILEHIVQIDQAAVMHMLCEIVGIMKVNQSFFVSLHNVGRKKETAGDVFADFSGHIIPLYTVDNGIFV